MQAVLMVAHGSRDKEANDQVRQFIEDLKMELDSELLVETCFLELEKPDIQEGIATCVAKGARKIAVIPMMLLQASHAKIHIPNKLDMAKEKYPDVHFTYGRSIGIHEAALDICQSRIEELGENIMDPLPQTAVLLVGRGGSDKDANSDLYKISRLLWERMNYEMVEPAFFAVTTPLVEAGIERCRKLGAKRIIILPYFLFTGVLIKRLEKMAEGYATKFPELQFELAGYLGLHRNLRIIFKERIEEAVNDNARMNCDTCKYRFEASQYIGHHHHHDYDHEHYHDHDHHHDHDHQHERAHYHHEGVR